MIFQNTDCCVPIHTPAHCPYLYTRSIRNHKPNPNVYRSASTCQIPTSISADAIPESPSPKRPLVRTPLAHCTPASRYPILYLTLNPKSPSASKPPSCATAHHWGVHANGLGWAWRTCWAWWAWRAWWRGAERICHHRVTRRDNQWAWFTFLSFVAKVCPLHLLRGRPSRTDAPYPGAPQEGQHHLCGIFLQQPLAPKDQD